MVIESNDDKTSVKLESFIVVHQQPLNVCVLGYDALMCRLVHSTPAIWEKVGKHLGVQTGVVKDRLQVFRMTYSQ